MGHDSHGVAKPHFGWCSNLSKPGQEAWIQCCIHGVSEIEPLWMTMVPAYALCLEVVTLTSKACRRDVSLKSTERAFYDLAEFKEQKEGFLQGQVQMQKVRL